MPEINYVWDPTEDNIVREYDEAGVVTAEYTTEPDLYGNVISQRRQGEYRQFHYDAQGSTLAVTDQNEQVTDTRAYNGFGETTESTGNTVLSYQYLGQHGYYTLPDTGDLLVRRRIYEPSRQRWISQDPVDRNDYNINAYSYSDNSPFARSDPSGELIVQHDGGFHSDPCKTVTKESYVARCEFHMASRGTWVEGLRCPSQDARACCGARAKRWGWDVYESSLYRRIISETWCARSLAPPGAVALCGQQPTATKEGAAVVAVLVLATLVGIWIRTKIDVVDIPVNRPRPPRPRPKDDVEDKKKRRCRCTIRHMPDPDRERFGCPDRVFGEGATRGECQEAAKLTAPRECRAYYGHCDWVQ